MSEGRVSERRERMGERVRKESTRGNEGRVSEEGMNEQGERE